MDWITGTIAIGSSRDARAAADFSRHNIRSLLCLDGSLQGKEAARIGVAEIAVFDLIDGPGNALPTFERAVRCAGRLSREHPNLLVHCHAGRSRSAVVVAAHLMLTEGLTMRDAIEHISVRRQICISEGMRELLRYPWLPAEQSSRRKPAAK